MLVSIFLFLFGCLCIFYGGWFAFMTVYSVLSKKEYTPFILILGSGLFSVGMTLCLIGVTLWLSKI